MKNSYGKIVLGVIVTVISITLGILWKMPFENAKATQKNRVLIQENRGFIQEQSAKDEARWQEECRRFDRIEKKLDDINHQ